MAYYKSTKSNDYSDKLYISFDGAATAGFDLKYDAYKFQSGTEGLSELYSFSDDKIFSIDVCPVSEVIQLGFYNSKNGVYNIAIKEVADISEATLEDTKTNTFHNLQNGSYEFVWDTVTDMMGRVVIQQDISGSGLIAIPVNLKTGIYVVMVQSGQEVKTEKVFIK